MHGSLTQPGHPWTTLNDIAVNSRRTAAICTLVLAAFRRLLRQEGAFVHQVRGEPKSVAWWCETLIESTCQDATKELGVSLMHPRINRAHCRLHAHLIDTVRVLPTDIATMHLPPVVNISLQNGKAGDRLGVIAVDSIHSAVFREMGYAPPERSSDQLHLTKALELNGVGFAFSFVHDRLHHAHFDDGGHERLQLVSFVMFGGVEEQGEQGKCT